MPSRAGRKTACEEESENEAQDRHESECSTLHRRRIFNRRVLYEESHVDWDSSTILNFSAMTARVAATV